MLHKSREIVNRIARRITWELTFRRVARTVGVSSWIAPTVIHVDKTLDTLQSSKIQVVPDVLNDNDVEDFRQRAEYEFYYPNYYVGRDLVRLKKIREHFIAARLLELTASDVYLDIASQYSPVPLVYERLYGCRVFRQDLEYPVGKHGRVLGGSASQIPMPDGSVTKMALHCSLEHFEGDEDIGLIREVERVLATSGRLAIVPLYLSDTYFVMTSVVQWASLPREQWPTFSDGIMICGSPASGNRHERYYSVQQFVERLVKNTHLSVRIHSFGEATEYGSGGLRFAAVFEKNK